MEPEQLGQQERVRRRVAPRPAGVGGPAGGLLGLQQSAGNAAVASMVGLQRSPLDNLVDPWAGGPLSGDGGGAATPDAAGIPAGGSPTDAGGAGPTAEPGGGMNELGPVAHVGTLIADSIVASSYTPGAGNIW